MRADKLCIRVCHGDPLAMAGLVWLVGQEPGFEVQPGQQADEGIVDVIVADHECALSLLASAAAFGPQGASLGFHVPRIVVVTRRDKESEIVQAIERGAHAYLLQDAQPAELMDAIRHVAHGGALYLCQRTKALLRRGTPRASLTAREEEVLRFLARGDCNKGIARKLDISASTVKAHVSRIREKLRATSRVQVAVTATQRGLVSR
ncbi:response regulator transcription factor [Variovorax paradoxus]|uniref:response regulator transcription factor n=1 Tax=Variovorax paradoxus TaxID=34073 RepID=UPI0027D87505|nr:DNA-binding response regulator [Variovorax paradoxus]